MALPLQLRYALRLLAKNPGFSIAAILVLALGIGANTAIFTVVRAVLLAPLPYQDPNRLVRLYERDVFGSTPFNVVSPENYRDWIAQSTSYERVAAYGDANFGLSSADGRLPEVLRSQIASANLFETLGVKPQRGRVYTAQEDVLEGPLLAVLSDSLWRRRYAADEKIVGSNIRLDGESYTVIGIMPAGFDFPDSRAQLWVPMWRNLSKDAQHSRGNHRLSIVARLKPGVTVEQARTELDGIAARIYQVTLGKELTGKGANVAPLTERTVAGVKPMLVMLFGAVACVLLIACVNVTNLLLTRALARRREVSIRAALGATRGQLLRQFLTESLLLSGIGAALGMWLAVWTTDALVSRAGNIPRIENAGMNSEVLWFTLAIAFITGVAVGLAPALSSSRVDLARTMNEGGRSSTTGKGTGLLRDGLVAVEVTLSLMLLIGCGLLLKSFVKLRGVDAGFSAERILTVRISLPSAKYTSNPQRLAFFESLLERTRALPGVESAGMVTVPPLGGHWSDETITIVGKPPLPPGQYLDALNRTADPEYFLTIGIPLKKGRFFTAADRLEQGADKMIVSELFARNFLPGEDPIGQRVNLGTPREIIGVVGDMRKTLASEPEPTMYTPLFRGVASLNTLVVRTAGDPLALAIPVQQELGRLDPDLPAFDIRSMDQIAESGTQQRRFGLTLLSLFAGLAVLLAAIGLYGVLSYSIEQRTAELGIRLALGASAGDIARMVVWQGMRPAAVGIVAGLAGGAAATSLLETLLYGVKPADPQVLIGVVALIVVIAAVACFVPAWRSTRIDPVVALRN